MFTDVERQSLWLGIGLNATWDFGNGIFKANAARLTSEAAAYKTEAEKNNALLRIVNIYYDLLAAKLYFTAYEELAKQARRCGAWMHVDAVQTGGRLPLDVNRLGVDLLSLSSHKIRGPKGAGALFVSREIDLQPITFGGKQEAGLRAGTENTLSIVGFGRAAELAREGLSSEPQRLAALRDRFEAQILESLSGLRVHGALQERLPSVTNLGFDGIEGEAALLMLDMAGVCASSGSACASGSLEPSHVLLAMGYSAEQAHGSIRFSFGHETRAEQLERVVELLIEKVPQLRALMLTI